MLFALVLRLWGINWQLPATLYHDEFKDVSAGVTGRMPDYRNPALYRHLLQVEYRLHAQSQRDRRGGPAAEQACLRSACSWLG